MIITTSNGTRFKVILRKTKLYRLVSLYKRLSTHSSINWDKTLREQCKFSLIDYEETRNGSGMFYVKPSEFQHMKGLLSVITVVSGKKFYSVENFGTEENHEFPNKAGKKVEAKAVQILVREMNDFEVLMLEPEVIHAPRTDDGVSIIIPL